MAIQFVFVRIILLSTNEFACSLPHTVPPARDSPSLFACNAYIPTYFKSRLKPGTENLTSRFIQLRKENGSLFTGRKYSAQAGWEHILQQMRQEFPTIMADVHYRVLKKKWSNLLQQYKELKNPVHGDKNKSDDVSWPFYSAIDQVLGYRNRVEEDDVNPHEFLCLSVTPEEPASPEEQHRIDSDVDEVASRGALQRIRNLNEDCSIEIEKLSRLPIRRQRSASRTSQVAQDLRRREVNDVLVSRLPPATELSIKTIRSTSTVPSVCVRNLSQDRDVPYHFLRDALAVAKRNKNHLDANNDGNRAQKMRKVEDPQNHGEGHVGCGLERRLTEFLEYTKRRDEENREIMTRILTAVEKIAEKR